VSVGFLFIIMELVANIKFCFRLGKIATEICKVLESVDGNDAICHMHV
jgi:hypothetical protein